MVAFTSPQPFPTVFQSIPQRQRSQPFPVTFQISPQFPDVLFFFGSAGFSFQHVQAAVDTLQVVLPELVMETVNHTSLPDPPKPLTDFLVHMVPIPEMLVALAAFCQFIEHILRIPTAPVTVAQDGASRQIVMVIQIGLQKFQDMLPVETGKNVKSCQDPPLSNLLHSGTGVPPRCPLAALSSGHRLPR